LIDDWPNGMPDLLDGKQEAFDDMSDMSKSRDFNMAIYLRNAYAAAVEMIGVGKKWKSAYVSKQLIHWQPLGLKLTVVLELSRSSTVNSGSMNFSK
jgi:hypothetical protein